MSILACSNQGVVLLNQKVKNLNILRTKEAFKVKKSLFIIFEGVAVVKNGLRAQSAPLSLY